MEITRVGDAWLDADLSTSGLVLVDDEEAEGLVTVAPPVELQPVAELEPVAWLRTFRAWTETPFFAAQAWLRAAFERGSGSWVAVTSDIATQPFPGGGAAGASAVCLQTLVRVAAVEGGPHGVRANVVAAGWGEHSMPSRLDRELAVTDTPLRRLATSADIADAVVWLMSPAASHVTGEVICLDGGYTITNGSRPDPARA